MTEIHFEKSSSGLFLPESCKRHSPIAVDLFCGCGGFSLGMIQAGWTVIAAVDQDPYAALTYLTNLGTHPVDLQFVDPSDRVKFEKVIQSQVKQVGPIQQIPLSGQHRPPDRLGVKHFWLGDIRKLKGSSILRATQKRQGDIDCVFGGPPCQGFSKIGKREVLDPRNSLLFEFARMILEIMPKTFVMENVPGILSMVTPEGIPVIEAFCRILSDGGFAAYDALLNSLKAQHGSWGTVRGQERKRDRCTDTNPQLSLFD